MFRKTFLLWGITCALAVTAVRVQADSKPDGTKSPAPVTTNCKAYLAGACCDPAVTAHLTHEAVFASCGQSDAVYLGEAAEKDTCKYIFKVEGEKAGDAFVQVYAPAQKDVPTEPNDPFFGWKMVGKAFVTSKALSPKSAPMLARSTGVWLPGRGYFVSVNASTKVCSKAQVTKLASKVR